MLFISILILIVAMALHSKYISPILFTRIAAIVFIYAGALSFNAFYIQSIGSGIGIYSGLFHVTTVSQLLDTFIFLIGSLILVAWPSLSKSSLTKVSPGWSRSRVFARAGSGSPGSLALAHPTYMGAWADPEAEPGSESGSHPVAERINNAAEYSLIVVFSTLGASLLVSSADLISMYLSIELQSFGVYILSTLYRDSESATSAGLKYFLLGGLSSCLILLGAGIIYSFTGLTNFESIYSIVSVSDSQSITQGLSLGLIIIIVGFLFKIAAAPLHNWSPDVYDDTPTIVTIWLTIMPKISIVIFLLELQSQIGLIGNGHSQDALANPDNVSILSVVDLLGNANSVVWPQVPGQTAYILKNLLLISSLLSLIIGTVVGLAQSRIKRLLTYSTISHIGFILLALAINSEQSVDSLIFYIIQYSITNLNTFLVILALGYIIKTSLRSYGLRTWVREPILTRVVISRFTSPSEQGGQDHGTQDALANPGLQDHVPQDQDRLTHPGPGDPHVHAWSTNARDIPIAPGRAADSVDQAHPEYLRETDIKFISELKGQFFANPLLSISLTVCLFSMAGIPPLMGFFAKQFVLYSAIQSGYYFMAIIGIIVSVISASYYLKVIKVLHSSIASPDQAQVSQDGHVNREPGYPSSCTCMVYESALREGRPTWDTQAADAVAHAHHVRDPETRANPEHIHDLEARGTESIITSSHSFLISTLTLSILLFVLKPSILLNSTQLLSLSLFYY